MASDKVDQLQLLQQNFQHTQVQKQQLEAQLFELDSALTHVEQTQKAYKILGRILVSLPKDTLLSELKEKKEVTKIRYESFVKQEEKLRLNIEQLQKDVVKELSSKSSSHE